MDILLLLLYFGFAYILFDAGKIITGKDRAIFLPRIIALSFLLILYILFIFIIPAESRHPVIVVILIAITSLFTLLASYLKSSFYRNFVSHMLRENNFVFYVYLFNLDYYSKALLRLKQIIHVLPVNRQQVIEELKNINQNSHLHKYIPWNRDVLTLLRFLNQTDIAASFYDSLNVDLSKPDIPLDFISLIINILIKKKRFSEIPPYFNYIKKYFWHSNHIQLVIYLYLSFYANTGCKEQFRQLLDKNPILEKDPLVPYWQGILYLKTGETEQGIALLTRLKENLPKHLHNFIPQIEQILNNPALHTETSEQGQAIASSILPPQSNVSREYAPPQQISKISRGIVFLCACVLLTTLTQFALSLAGTRIDFIGFKYVVPLDYISLGAYSDYFVNKGEWGRLLTAIFLHAGWLHLLINIYGLFITGRITEKAYGTFPMIMIFLLSGLSGNFASHILSPYPLSVGASGGVFGLLASILIFVIWRRKFIDSNNLRSFFINFAVILGINIMFGLQNPRINNIAHLGGFSGGIFFSLLCLYFLRKPETQKILYIISRVSVISCAVLLLFFWPRFYYQHYFDQMELSQKTTINGYEMQVPEFWEKHSLEENITSGESNSQKNDNQGKNEPGNEGKEKINTFVDFLTGNKILVFKDEINNTVDLKMNIEDEIHYYLATDNYGKDYELRKPLIELNNGWYSFSLQKKSDKEDYYDVITFYAKSFHASVCRVMSFSLKKYTNGFEGLLYRALEYIRE